MGKTLSYSQSGQDLWVLSLFPKRYIGTFLDIGCQHPIHISNTYLLELKGWSGIAVDIIDYSEEWMIRPNTKFIQADALTFDFKGHSIDYLSLDIEGEGLRFKALQNLIDNDIKCITIEHDAYRGYAYTEREPQRKLLKKRGFTLAQSNVSSNKLAFEDWWINYKLL